MMYSFPLDKRRYRPLKNPAVKVIMVVTRTENIEDDTAAVSEHSEMGLDSSVYTGTY